MQLWTFGLTLLLLLSTWNCPSNADQDENDEEDEPEDNCRILKERRCHNGKARHRTCTETTYFTCTPTCRSYSRSKTTRKVKNSRITTFYLCSPHTVISTPSVSMSRSIQIDPSQISETVGNGQMFTLSSITPSFPMSSIADEDYEDGSGEDSGDGPDTVPSSSVLISSSISRMTSSPLSSTLPRTSVDRGSGEKVFSSVAPSFTLPFPSKFSLTSSSMVFGESGVSSISSSSYVPTSVPFSGSGSGESEVDECQDQDGGSSGDDYSDEDGSDEDGSDEDGSDEDGTGEDGTGGGSGDDAKITGKPIGTYANSKHGGTMYKPKTQSLRKKRNSCLTPSVTPVAMTTISFHSSGSSSYILPSTTSSVLPMVNTLTAIPKSNGTTTAFPSRLISTSGIFQSTSAGTRRTRMTTKITLTPSISIPILSSSYSSTPSATPPLSSLSSSSVLSSQSSRSIVSTPSTSSAYSEINSTVLSTYMNATVNQSTPITPTVTSTVSISSSVLTVHCGESETGEKFDKGVLTWKTTPVGSRANTSCPYSKDKSAIAYRWCRMDKENLTQFWDDVHDENCSVLEKDTSFDELLQEEVNEETEERLAVLTEYVTSTSNATVDFVKDGAELLEKLVDKATDLSKIKKELLNAVSNVMNADPEVLAEANKEHSSTTKILENIGKLMDRISLSGENIRESSTNLVAEAWDVVNKTTNLTFEINTEEKDSDDDSLVFVNLPVSLLQRYKRKQRITFINFFNDKLFPQRPSGDKRTKLINSKIVSASVKDDEVKNLTDPVVIEFKLTNNSYNNWSCVFWDFEADGGLGRWSKIGCTREAIGDGRARCHCNHLTHFGILVDIFPDEELGETDQLILQGITFVGCYLSIVGLVLTMITLLSFKQYRSGVSGQILLNLCLALLFSLVTFLAGIERVENQDACVAIAALLHYFILCAVLWMGLEAFHMFVNIVWDRHPRALGRTFVLKCAAVAWVIPLFIVGITVLVKTDDYRNDRYCRVTGNSFYIAFLTPTLAVLFFNVIAFFLVAKALLSTRVPRDTRKQGVVHFRRVLGIAVIFGITWLFGVLAVGELKLIFQYLFCITNVFQGFMIFILYCLTDRKVREKLVRTLCALPDPNVDHMVNTNSTQNPTDIEIDLGMFTGGASSPNPAPMVRDENDDPVIIYPPNYMVGSGYDPNILQLSYGSNRTRSMYPSYSLEPEQYNPRNPPGSFPVTYVDLPGEVNSSGDRLVDSTRSQLELSGGSARSILFIDNGRRVEVPKYPETSGANNNWEDSGREQIDSRMPTSGGPRRYSQGGDGLSFFKTPRQNRLNSAPTCDNFDRRFILPKSKRNRGVHFPTDQQTCPIREPMRWSDMPEFPRLKTRPRQDQDDISEYDECDGASMSRVDHGSAMGISPLEHEQRQEKRVIDKHLEEEYLKSFGDNEELEISSNFIAVSKSRDSREFKTMVVPKKEAPVETRKGARVRQSLRSSGSDTSSEIRWSEAERGPNLKSRSQTTFSDLDSDDFLSDHFTQL